MWRRDGSRGYGFFVARCPALRFVAKPATSCCCHPTLANLLNAALVGLHGLARAVLLLPPLSRSTPSLREARNLYRDVPRYQQRRQFSWYVRALFSSVLG